MRTIVVFRKWKQKTLPGNTILALFPEEAADRQGQCNSYEHIGQHGGADYAGCIAGTVPATPAEYKELATELRRIGYKLDIRSRATRAMTAKRLANARK